MLSLTVIIAAAVGLGLVCLAVIAVTWALSSSRKPPSP